MTSKLFIAIGLACAFPAAALAQSCLSFSSGTGDTTVSCPDGTTGYVRTEPGGAASGMIGTQPFAGSAASLAPPFGPAVGVPSAAYIAPPVLSIAPPVPAPPVETATASAGAVLSAPPGTITPLKQRYLAEQAARHRRAAKQSKPAGKPAAAKAGPTPKPKPKAKPRYRIRS